MVFGVCSLQVFVVVCLLVIGVALFVVVLVACCCLLMLLVVNCALSGVGRCLLSLLFTCMLIVYRVSCSLLAVC